jgi:hypothetical protein
MWLTPRRPSRQLSSARRASLLGWYPVSELCMAGAHIRPNPRSSPDLTLVPPPLLYGIDYTFARLVGGSPVRWPSGLPITVRITSPSVAGFDRALAIVVSELRELTRFDIAVGDPWPDYFQPGAVPEGEIHVSFLPDFALRGLSPASAHPAGIGVTLLKGTGRCYTQGFAAVNADLAGTGATGKPGLTVLRHELAHALGMGHSARPGLVMHDRVMAGLPGYDRGDQFGLRMLGDATETPQTPSSLFRAEEPTFAAPLSG